MIAQMLTAIAKRRPPIDWGPPLSVDIPADDPAARQAYDEAAKAAREQDDERLVALASRPWQTPVWTKGLENPELRDFRAAADRLVGAGQNEEAYRLGSALLEADGAMIQALVGLSIRRKSNWGSEAISVDRYHAVLRSEFDRWIMPSLAACTFPDLDEEEGPWKAKNAAVRIIWGGVAGAADRAETLQELVRMRDEALAREPDEMFYATEAARLSPMVPVETLQTIVPYTASLRLALAAPALRNRPNGYGRYTLSKTWTSLSLFAGAFHIARLRDKRS